MVKLSDLSFSNCKLSSEKETVTHPINSNKCHRGVAFYEKGVLLCSKSTLPNTLKCLSIGTLKTINFAFVSNGKLMAFRCPNIQAYYNEAVIYLNFGTPKNNEFSIWNKWKINYFKVSQYLSTLGYF